MLLKAITDLENWKKMIANTAYEKQIINWIGRRLTNFM